MKYERDSSSQAEQESIIKTARVRLANLGMSLERLADYKKVLDIGARDCIIEKAAKSIGINSVVSVDKNFPPDVLQSDLTVLKADAKHMDLPYECADLALIGSSAYYYSQTEAETFEILGEINRCLKKGGSQRVYPARFGHVIKCLMNEHSNFQAAKAKAMQRRTKADLGVIEQYDNQAEILSVNFLKTKTIQVYRKEVLEPNPKGNFKHYLEIPKF
ncbi:MAG: hypothetical protein COT92_03470 [Candidatus Doudnabacteria bacterium CG10_big_fil_rev_8_21_14_0_10_42_18]|uniref:Methyltransferase type 11 domain-containing protein n=1 Tax=Candidatus Doudnabacteria bacterium CG10_big_fil_rev_8_21_14_0_10_42_18 TaxID=1974552 RepID=A0A2H0VA65_9BACT|nr:MAG: hypothetical protein COT92_03470 [Candidatus Doudnabacteria bacterium CG10_big_fil_rev_8_21_14_0_10_42_18]